MLWVVAPFDQTLSLGELLVRITLSPEQKVNGPLAVMVGVAGVEFKVTSTTLEVSETQPFAFVTNTQCVPDVETVMS